MPADPPDDHLFDVVPIAPDKVSTAPPRATPTDLSTVLLDHLDVGVWAIAPDGTVLAVNRAAAATIGEQPDTLIGRRFTDLVDTVVSGEAEYIWPVFCRDFEAGAPKWRSEADIVIVQPWFDVEPERLQQGPQDTSRIADHVVEPQNRHEAGPLEDEAEAEPDERGQGHHRRVVEGAGLIERHHFHHFRTRGAPR